MEEFASTAVSPKTQQVPEHYLQALIQGEAQQNDTFLSTVVTFY
jgi:hypothetical protein